MTHVVAFVPNPAGLDSQTKAPHGWQGMPLPEDRDHMPIRLSQRRTRVRRCQECLGLGWLYERLHDLLAIVDAEKNPCPQGVPLLIDRHLA